MPFVKLGENRYKGPSGKVFNEKQVQLYYARGGTFQPNKQSHIESAGVVKSKKRK